jgi:two-component system OmpR family response regulator
MDRILIIDDHREMRELLGHCFRKWSFATVTAGSLGEAREAFLKEGPFKLIICDFDLPDGNGLQFFSWLRLEQHNHARFLLMSGSTNFVRYSSEDFMFLAKPFRSEQLRSRVEELIGTKPDAR